jgi:hypothetical protein
VTPTPDRDRAVEELLRARRTRDAEPAPPADATCPDASQLAAWADGALSAREAEALESHLATCVHCEAVLAAFAKAAPPSRPPFWRRWAVLVPLAAATAAAAVWFIVVPERQHPVGPAPTVARLEPPGLALPPSAAAPPQASQEVAPPAAARAPEKESAAPTARRAAPSDRKPGAFTTDQLLAPSAKAVPTRPAPAPEPQPAAPPLPVFRPVQPPALPSPPPPPPVAAQAGLPARNADARSATVVAESPLVDTKKVATLVEFTSPMVDAVDQPTVTTGGGDASAAAGASVVGARGGGGGRGGARGGAQGGFGGGIAQGEVLKPVGPTRWRILASGTVERASGDGAAWSPIAIDPSVRLTSGVAPSATTCWLVGRGGVVLVAKDAVHFVRMDIPVPLDLVSVTATALAVTVTAADGSTFMTVDGGLTWKRPTP